MDTIIAPTGHTVNYCFRVDTTQPSCPALVDWMQAELRRREWRGADFARQLGVPNGTVARWLRGERCPSPSSCDLIADVLGADPDMVLTLAGHRPAIEQVQPDDPNVRICALLRRADLSKHDRVGFLEDTIRRWIRFDREHSEGDG